MTKEEKKKRTGEGKATRSKEDGKEGMTEEKKQRNRQEKKEGRKEGRNNPLSQQTTQVDRRDSGKDPPQQFCRQKERLPPYLARPTASRIQSSAIGQCKNQITITDVLCNC